VAKSVAKISRVIICFLGEFENKSYKAPDPKDQRLYMGRVNWGRD
jgi:hypothetical protein